MALRSGFGAARLGNHLENPSPKVLAGSGPAEAGRGLSPRQDPFPGMIALLKHDRELNSI